MTAQAPCHRSYAPPGPGWVRLGELARALDVSERTFRRRAERALELHRKGEPGDPYMPADAIHKVGRCWWFQAAAVRPWVVALARADQAGKAGRLDPTRWTDNGVRRDADIRKTLEDADASAAFLHAKRLSLTDADRVYCIEHDIGLSTLRRWRRIAAAGGTFHETRGRKRGGEEPGAKAAGLFLRFYRQPGAKFRTCFRMVRAAADRHAGDPAWRWPSEATARRWMDREHPPFYMDRSRKGNDHWRAQHEPKLDRAPLDLPGNTVWEIDGSKCNFFGQHNGRKVRFEYALLVDVGSRLFMGHAVALSESTELLVRALRRGALKYGAPKVLRCDQGKANLGAGVGDARRRKAGVDWEKITGVVADCMAEFQVIQGRSGWMKGTVESAVRTVGMGFDPLFGKAYLGNNTDNRIRGVDKWADDHPDELSTLADVDRLLGEFLDAQNRRPRADLGGVSPLQKFNATAIEFRKVPDAVLGFRLLRAQRTKATNRGVAIRTGGAVVYFGQGDPRVWERNGQELVARINDDDLGQVLLCDKTGRPLFYVANDHLRGVTSETLREVGKRKAKARKAVREHWENIDLAARPTVDEAIRLQREDADRQAAKARRPAARERGVIVLHSQFEQELKRAQRTELQATGTDETDATDDASLADVVSVPADARDGAADFTLDDLDGMVMEDQDDDPMPYLT